MLNFVKGKAVSYEIGIMKPAREYFEKTLDVLEVKAEECVFIDDNPNNVSAAEELGIAGITFTDLDQLKSALGEKGIS